MCISVLILTLNEEVNLSRCLESVSWSDDVVVFDSFSSDRTSEIARAAGARVVHRRFDNERDHRAASLSVGFKHRWVFNPDADEIATPGLRDEMLAICKDASPHVAYRVRFRTMFMGRWIRHSSLYPTWIVRLFRPEAVSFERSVNLRYNLDGSAGRLQNELLHYSFNKGLAAWLEKHNRYSSAEANEMLSSLSSDLCLSDLFVRDPIARRRALKDLSFRVPCRPALRFLYAYLWRRGFLDGIAGFHYCLLMSSYEHMISLKCTEIRRRSAGLPL